MNINVDVGIILGWTSLNWSIIVDDISCEHAGNSSVAAIAPSCSSIHCSNWFSTNFFKNCEVSWYIKLYIKTAALISSFDHNNNTLSVSMSLVGNFICCISEIVCRYLDDSWSLDRHSLLIILHHFFRI